MKRALRPAIAALDEAVLTPDEWNRLAAIPVTEEETAETRDLVAWFKRRYPTVKERMAYARRKYAEITRSPEIGDPR